MVHPQRWLQLVLSVALGLTWGSLAAAQSSCPAAGPAEIMCGELQQDIDLLNVINRLDLQPAQLPGLLQVHAGLTQEAEKLSPQREALYSQLVPMLREKRSQLLQDKAPGDDLEKQITLLMIQVETLGDEWHNVSLVYAAEIRKILSGAQLQILTGADEALAQAEELLDWIRDLPVTSYKEEAEANAEALADPELNLPAAAIMQIFEKARQLGAAEYGKNKASLLQQLAPLYMPMPEAADESAVQFLSSSRVGGILMEKADKAEVRP